MSTSLSEAMERVRAQAGIPEDASQVRRWEPISVIGPELVRVRDWGTDMGHGVDVNVATLNDVFMWLSGRGMSVFDRAPSWDRLMDAATGASMAYTPEALALGYLATPEDLPYASMAEDFRRAFIEGRRDAVTPGEKVLADADFDELAVRDWQADHVTYAGVAAWADAYGPGCAWLWLVGQATTQLADVAVRLRQGMEARSHPMATVRYATAPGVCATWDGHDRYGADNSESAMAEFASPGVLLLDSLGAETISRSHFDALATVLRGRARSMRPTVIASGGGLREWLERYAHVEIEATRRELAHLVMRGLSGYGDVSRATDGVVSVGAAA